MPQGRACRTVHARRRGQFGDAWERETVKRIERRPVHDIDFDVLIMFATTCSNRGLAIHAENVMAEKRALLIMEAKPVAAPRREKP
jgi:hypothetical protein